MARPLSKTYDPANPFVAERHDQEDGSIVYEIWDHRPETYRRLCVCAEDYCEDDDELVPDNRGQTKKDADMIATALNTVFGQREFKSAKLRAIGSHPLTEAEMKAQAQRCDCHGSDDYCPCQNRPDQTTLAERKRARDAHSRPDNKSADKPASMRVEADK